jgi:hypothetical protein
MILGTFGHSVSVCLKSWLKKHNMENRKLIELQQKIKKSTENSLLFFEKLKSESGIKYTLNHDIRKYPAAELYGTWSYVLGKSFLLGNTWENEGEKIYLAKKLKNFQQKDGSFYPKGLDDIKNSKSHEYLKMHTSNYALGAMMILDPKFDFQSSFFDRFLDADYLTAWLKQRSFIRPWEESNNIVNVAAYLALNNDSGNSNALPRLYQMLEWHNKFQNPRSGGFDGLSTSRNHISQSMAGAVHNFHIHHYLNEPMNFESVIGKNMIPFLYEGPLTACLSIDFVELACHTIGYVDSKHQAELASALLYHLEALLNYQNSDGGWYENASKGKPTTAAGMKEVQASSCSYATWFRLCSIGMISNTLLGSDLEKWNFRDTLGMGYHPNKWTIYDTNKFDLDKKVKINYKFKNLPSDLFRNGIQLISKLR